MALPAGALAGADPQQLQAEKMAFVQYLEARGVTEADAMQQWQQALNEPNLDMEALEHRAEQRLGRLGLLKSSYGIPNAPSNSPPKAASSARPTLYLRHGPPHHFRDEFGKHAARNFKPVGTVGPDGAAHYNTPSDAAAARKFHGDIFAGGRDFQSGIKSFASVDALSDANAKAALQNNNLYASINTGELYFKQGSGAVKVYHFISGYGFGANNPTADGLKERGPLPEGGYTLHFNPKYGSNYRNTGFEGMQLRPDSGNDMHHRDGFLIHMAHWNGTWGCLGINPHEMADFQRTVHAEGYGKHLISGNTGHPLAAPAPSSTQRKAAEVPADNAAASQAKAKPAPAKSAALKPAATA
jgi:hypothetical protein